MLKLGWVSVVSGVSFTRVVSVTGSGVGDFHRSSILNLWKSVDSRGRSSMAPPIMLWDRGSSSLLEGSLGGAKALNIRRGGVLS